MRATLLAAALMLIGCSIGHQSLAETIKLKPLKVSGDFEGKGNESAADISGISCPESMAEAGTCLLVNDENKNAQFATFKDRTDNKDKLTVGDAVTLIGDERDPKTLGRAPEGICTKDDGFKDLDGEGVAYAKPYFYVVGSHGCSRSKGLFRLSSFILARFDPAHPDRVTTTYRVSDLLQASDKVSPFFGKNLNTENGLNIEGIAVIGDTLWVGLRAPVTGDGDAYLLSGSISDVFREGHDPGVKPVHTMGIKLDKRGIRDLAPLPDGRILVLAGPAQDQDVTYKLYIANPATNGNTELGTLESISKDGTIGKAEGLTVIEVTGNKAKLLVVFDGLKNGDPHSGEVDLPQ
jgi:hypothetical protein